jgi:hypothetical protein
MRFDLIDDEWALSEPLMPKAPNQERSGARPTCGRAAERPPGPQLNGQS